MNEKIEQLSHLITDCLLKGMLPVEVAREVHDSFVKPLEDSNAKYMHDAMEMKAVIVYYEEQVRNP